MKTLNFQLKKLCDKNRDGNYLTQRNRDTGLQKIANDCYILGYKDLVITNIKEKHVFALVGKWINEGLSARTIKNRMSHIRWWLEKVGKHKIASRTNEYFGVPLREYVLKESKAQHLNQERLAEVKDAHVRMSLELQQVFGLRREEAIKFIPSYADRGDKLVLKPSWTKGGKAREIPILTDKQREVLNRATMLAGKGSLIPPSKKYIEQLRVYEKQTVHAKLCKMHGLRHAYAQQRYEALTGWKCPIAGGLSNAQFTYEQKILDKQVRLKISKELGHERLQILSLYIGS